MTTRATSLPIVIARFAAVEPKRTQPPKAHANCGELPFARFWRGGCKGGVLKTRRGLRDGLAPRRWRRGLRERLAPRRWEVSRSDLVPGEWPARPGTPIQAGKWARDGAVALVLGCPKGIDSRDADLDGRGRSTATLSAASPFVIASKAAAPRGV